MHELVESALRIDELRSQEVFIGIGDANVLRHIAIKEAEMVALAIFCSNVSSELSMVHDLEHTVCDLDELLAKALAAFLKPRLNRPGLADFGIGQFEDRNTRLVRLGQQALEVGDFAETITVAAERTIISGIERHRNRDAGNSVSVTLALISSMLSR